jgi:hypothetical protein
LQKIDLADIHAIHSVIREMLPLSIRPLATRATIRLVPTLIRANTLSTPFPLRTIATAPDAVTKDATTIPEPTSASAPAEAPASGEAQAEGQEQARLPYFVGRNSLNNLSVYTKIKRGGNRKLTHLKHGEGDLMALKEDIRHALGLEKDEISINNVTKHVVIKVCNARHIVS